MTAIDKQALRAAILDHLKEYSSDWTYVIRNSLTTTQVRRECERMKRDGLLEYRRTDSALYINWGLTAGGRMAAGCEPSASKPAQEDNEQ